MKKTKKNDFIAIRLPTDLKNQIRAEAERERRTLAGQVLVLIEAGLNAQAQEAAGE